ncbi:hypothetical protein [Streptomyces sp. NRRL F-5123]|uniref:hypothetical protein n=1 Tax=Streptomyces sp. NRRL F-5123 TaxID=1463856 RepID=UPI000B253485|nr:hypothetical protein [Streptomyces sp. NRRL F-5123]
MAEWLDASVPAPNHQRIMNALEELNGAGRNEMDCRQLAAALGLEPVPAKVEGVRSKAKRLTARGWSAEGRPGMVSTAR